MLHCITNLFCWLHHTWPVLIVYLISCLLPLTQHASPEGRDLIWSIHPCLCRTAPGTHLIKVRMRNECWSVSVLSRMLILLTHLIQFESVWVPSDTNFVYCLVCHLCQCVYIHTARSIAQGFLLIKWITISSCFHLSLTFNLANLN